MPLRPADLSVAKSDVVAKILAIGVWEAAERLDTEDDPYQESTRRLLRRHARELLALHDVPADEVLGLNERRDVEKVAYT